MVSDRRMFRVGTHYRFDPTVGRPGVVFGDESASVGGTVRVDPEPELVDGDMVVVKPQCSLTRRADWYMWRVKEH